MMSSVDREALDQTLAALVRGLLERQAAASHWEGRLASSALSTATASIALAMVARRRGGRAGATHLQTIVGAGVSWLLGHQNDDGGWGDTVRSRSNLSTTALVWAALSEIRRGDPAIESAIAAAAAWLRVAAGDTTPDALGQAILRRYGSDKTFSVPILTVLALTGKLGDDDRDAWQSVPQLPFELAALPHRWFQYLQLPVVSYALPALVAMGQVRHHFAPTRRLLWRWLRGRVRGATLDVLRTMQPASGGYLEATPLTSFVVMSLAAIGEVDGPVVEGGVRFLAHSVRDDGSWPIDTNLATWVTTSSVSAIADAGAAPQLRSAEIREWLFGQQNAQEHPFTHAAPGGWAWTPLTGGVPDADDTAGALVALHRLDPADAIPLSAITAGVRWLLGVQNRDGGIPTFCRGWGALPFDRSTPEVTAHALEAWSAWRSRLDPKTGQSVGRGCQRALAFVERSQRPDGTWVPLWFGNERAPDEQNPTYGTSRVLLGLDASLARMDPRTARCRQRGTQWLLGAQNQDGGWGGDQHVASSIEETGIALAALCRCARDADASRVSEAAARAVRWMIDATQEGERVVAAPIGFYFARLWYFEELYPFVFGTAGLAAARTYFERVADSP